MSHPRRLATLAPALLLAAGCSSEDPVERAVDAGVSNIAELPVVLTGAAEVPGPGQDLAAPMEVELRLLEPSSATRLAEVCLTLLEGGSGLADLDGDVTGMHVHEGDEGEAGDVVLDLGAITVLTPGSQVCLDAESAAVHRVVIDPSAYYLNVHTTTFPDGAVRGQLD